MRIVSLLPSATEIVYALGLEDSLVGVTYECDFPPEARTKPSVMSTSLPVDQQPSPAEIDAVVRERMESGELLYRLHDDMLRELAPDLILTQDLCRVCAVPTGQVEEALDRLGCRADVLSLDPHSIDEILASIVEVARWAGVEGRGEEVAAGLRSRLAGVVDAVAGRDRPRTLMLEWSDPPFNGGHWVPEMVEQAGGTAVLSEAGRPSRRLAWPEVAAASPDTVVFIPCGYGLDEALAEAPTLAAVPELAQTPALQAGRLFATDASAYFSRPGPRIVGGIEALASVLHPHAGVSPPPGSIAPALPASAPPAIPFG